MASLQSNSLILVLFDLYLDYPWEYEGTLLSSVLIDEVSRRRMNSSFD